jgi:hypothetical protein
MRLVRDHDDIVPFAVGLGNVLVEFVYQAENKAMILAQQLLQVFPGLCPRRFFIRHTAPHKCSENLVVEVLSVRHEHESEVAGHYAPNFLSEERH